MSIYEAERVGRILDRAARGITRAAGYETDIGTCVYRGRVRIDPDKVPCVSIIEGPDRVLSQAARRGDPEFSIARHYILAAYANCDPDAPNDTGHAIIRDLKRLLYKTPELSTLLQSTGIRHIKLKGSDIGPRADGLGVVFATVEVEIEFVETMREEPLA